MAMTKAKSTVLTVTPPSIRAIKVRLVGTSPLMQARFSQKAMKAMSDVMTGEKKKGTRGAREAKNFEEDYKEAMHMSSDDWVGFPAGGLRAALISSCRLVGFVMTRAKLSVFVLAEGYDRVDNQALIRIHGKPEMNIAPVRNANGAFDLRARPIWREWYVEPIISFDEDQFSTADVLNLLSRVGLQIGLGEGRHDSRNSSGMGYGCFKVEGSAEEVAVQ